MKKIILLAICMYRIINIASAQTNMKRDAINAKYMQVFDSLNNQSADFFIIKEKYKDPYKNYEKLDFPKDEIILSNGILSGPKGGILVCFIQSS
jgi:hypothetical protein